jgi:SpoVK/Ycf46/Vps4 family AAA+-type ATPase
MSVHDATERELATFADVPAALAAIALVLADQLDNPNSATSKSMCARELREVLDRIRELQPPVKEKDGIDAIRQQRRERILARATAAQDRMAAGVRQHDGPGGD